MEIKWYYSLVLHCSSPVRYITRVGVQRVVLILGADVCLGDVGFGWTGSQESLEILRSRLLASRGCQAQSNQTIYQAPSIIGNCTCKHRTSWRAAESCCILRTTGYSWNLIFLRPTVDQQIQPCLLLHSPLQHHWIRHCLWLLVFRQLCQVPSRKP